MRAVSAFYSGKWDGGDLPKLAGEHVLARSYGWKLEYIESLPAAKAQMLISMCFITERLTGSHL